MATMETEEGLEAEGLEGGILASAADNEEDVINSKGHQEVTAADASPADMIRRGGGEGKQQQQRGIINNKKKRSGSNSNIIRFVDHFTLEQPTSLVRFRGSKTTVHDLRNSQIQLEEHTTTTTTMTPLLNKQTDQADRQQQDASEEEGVTTTTTTTTTTILIKNVQDENAFALNALRILYSLECLFFYGILLAFCLLTLVFLLMDIVVFAGVDTSKPPPSTAVSVLGTIGTILAVPLYVHGLASAMSICGMYVCDTWNGHVFLRSLGQGGGKLQDDDAEDKKLYNRTTAIIWVEWTTFLFLLGIPMLGFIVGLFIGSDTWWNIGLLTWFSCVTTYYVFFCFCVIFFETKAAVYFLRLLATSTGQDDSSGSWKSLLRHAILIRQKVQFSGVAEYVRLSHHLADKKSRRQPEDGGGGDNNNNEDPARTTLLHHNSTRLYSRMTLLACCGCVFEKSNHDSAGVPGERLYSTADILGTRQFATFQSWSLEKMFCSNHRIQTVAVVRPKNVALTQRQMSSSLACTILGILLVALIFAALVTWFAGGGAVLMIILVGICCFPRIRFTARVYKMYQNVAQANQDDDDEQHQKQDDDGDIRQQGNETVVIGDEYAEQGTETIDGIHQTYEKYRVTRPKACFCWFVFYLEIILFFLFPAAALFAIGNYAVVVLFLIIGTLSLLRYYFNPSVLVKELGSFDRVCPTPDEEGQDDDDDDGDEEGASLTSKKGMSDSQWNEKSRLSNIIINVTRGPSRSAYMWIFAIFSFVSIVYTIAALNTTPEEAISTYDDTQILPMGAFVYDQQDDLPYPTCQMKKGLDLSDEVANGEGSAALLDYAYLSLWAYMSPEFAQVRKWRFCG
jgi:hypothetical protein